MDKRDKLHMLVHNFVRDYKIESDDRFSELVIVDPGVNQEIVELVRELVETVGYWDRGE